MSPYAPGSAFHPLKYSRRHRDYRTEFVIWPDHGTEPMTLATVIDEHHAALFAASVDLLEAAQAVMRDGGDISSATAQKVMAAIKKATRA